MLVGKYDLMIRAETGIHYLKKRGVIKCDDFIVSSPKLVADFVKKYLKIQTYADEFMYLLAVNAKCRILGVFMISKGSNNNTFMDVRGILVRSLVIGASYMIIVHNHPSQDCTPSEEDIRSTSRLRDAGNLVGLPLADHLIVGEGYYSFKENNKIG